MCPIPALESAVPLPPVPPEDTDPAKAELNRAALSHQEGLENSLSAILKYLEIKHDGGSDLKGAVLAAQNHALGLKQFLSEHIDTKLYNERHSDLDLSTVVQKTFDIAELLEMILNYVQIPDIVNMSQVNHSLNDSIRASTKLRDKMSLRPAPPETFIYAPFEKCLFRSGGFRCTLVDSRYSEWEVDALISAGMSNIDVRAYFFPFKGQRLPRIGSTYRSMFVTQPPIKEMHAYTSCCHGSSGWSRVSLPKLSTISSKHGLTIGHLYDCAQKLMKEHRWCPFASAFSLEDDGVVKTEVHFKGSMALTRDHPIERDRRAADERNREQYQGPDLHTSKLVAYTREKIRAYTNGDTIPSLHEFETANAGVDWVELAYPSSRAYNYPYAAQSSSTMPLFPPTPFVPAWSMSQFAIPEDDAFPDGYNLDSLFTED